MDAEKFSEYFDGAPVFYGKRISNSTLCNGYIHVSQYPDVGIR